MVLKNVLFFKAPILGLFVPYNFDKLSPACGTNIFKGMYGETLDFQCNH